MGNQGDSSSSVPPEGGQQGGSGPGPRVQPENTRPLGKSLGGSHETRVAPENTRALREGAVPPENTRLLPLDDSGNN